MQQGDTIQPSADPGRYTFPFPSYIHVTPVALRLWLVFLSSVPAALHILFIIIYQVFPFPQSALQIKECLG